MSNKYTDFFRDKNADQRLYEDIINEVTDYYGIESYYMVRSSLTNFDSILGDDPAKSFSQAYPVTVYIQTVDMFEGFEAISKLGLVIRKQARFLLPTRLFTQRMPSGFGRPREGDILYLKNFKAFFEIKKADEEHLFYTFAKDNIYAYSLVSEKWNYDQATVNTGVVQIDTTANNIVLAYEMSLSNVNATGTFSIGEEITGNLTGANATVVFWNNPTGNLVVKFIRGVFSNEGDWIVGSNSGATWQLTDINVRDSVNEALVDNQDIATEGDEFLIFSADNPFGEPQQ